MQKIRIKFIDDGRTGPYFTYEFEISNGEVTINLEIGADNFWEFGEKLKKFPLVQFSDAKDFIATYHYGTRRAVRSGNWMFHFSLEVSIWKTNGHPIIKVMFERADGDNAEFSIRTVPYSIVTLGNMLSAWNTKEEKELIWIAE